MVAWSSERQARRESDLSDEKTAAATKAGGLRRSEVAGRPMDAVDSQGGVIVGVNTFEGRNGGIAARVEIGVQRRVTEMRKRNHLLKLK